jgi:hypothetical protein
MTPEVMQKLTGLAGITLPNAKPAIDALILTQVYDLVSMGATEAGAHRLLGLLKEHRGTASFAHVFLGGDAMQRQAKASDTLLAAVYGHDLSRRISNVASAIGIPSGAASSLMGLLMSTVVRLLGREVRERGLAAAGLVHMLRGERETVERAMPADLVNRADRRPARAASSPSVEPLPPHHHVHRAIRPQQQEPSRVASLRQVGERVHRGHITPVQVFEHEHQGRGPSQRVESFGHLAQHPPRGHVRDLPLEALALTVAEQHG